MNHLITMPQRPQGGASSPNLALPRSAKVGNVVYAAAVSASAMAGLVVLSPLMDVYEHAMLIMLAPVLISLGWAWRALQGLVAAVGVLAAVGVHLYARTADQYGADLSQADSIFLLKYVLSSQSAILWMALMVFMSTGSYVVGLVAFKAPGTGRSNLPQVLGRGFAWLAVLMALLGTVMRWYESHQIGPHIGHIPVSNLYEVFVLFIWVTTLFYLYFERQPEVGRADGGQGHGSLGAFVMLLVSGAVAFLLWYALARGAQDIQPLVPALQSWWMKLHVPANFIGYGTFGIAAMVALASLLRQSSLANLFIGLIAAPLLTLAALAIVVQFIALDASTSKALRAVMNAIGGVTLFLAVVVGARRRIAARLPAPEVLEEVIYRAIAVGFCFFTIATILGALWAAEAWGGYWSWDPKETWALIVWLNYAAWLHMRLMKGMRGVVTAWWALVGLLLTTFAFLGVNMFLSGLHSYGEL